jgi:hypothetical protein
MLDPPSLTVPRREWCHALVIAVQPIEINSPRGSGTCIVIRAGGSFGKNAAYSSFSFRERALVSHEDGRVDNQRWAAPTGAEDSVQVGEGLPRLLREGCASGLAGRGIDTRLP